MIELRLSRHVPLFCRLILFIQCLQDEYGGLVVIFYLFRVVGVQFIRGTTGLPEIFKVTFYLISLENLRRQVKISLIINGLYDLDLKLKFRQ